MRAERTKLAGIVLGVLGMALSFYLLFSDRIFCLTDVCGTLRILNLPEYFPAVLGLIWFLFSILIFTGIIREEILLNIWRFSGVFGVGFLGTYALLHSYFCPYCFTSYAIGILQILISESGLN